MIFYTYYAPGMFPSRCAGLVVSIRQTAGGSIIRSTGYAGTRAEHYLTDGSRIGPYIRLVCPD